MHLLLQGNKTKQNKALFQITMGNVQGFLLLFKEKQFYYLQVPVAKHGML